jgi:Tol biopolymer transport system component/DNA-binding winged helix-turn-helix (wHTH) protein
MGVSEETHSTVVLFGSFEADLASGELRKGGVRLKLPEQSFKVLETLLEHPGEIVSRDELQKHVWTSDTHVGFERNLNTIVHTLRAALGDSARNPRFIETVHGRGYRLLTPARIAPRTVEAAVEWERPRRRIAAAWVFGAAAILLMTSIGFWRAAEATNGRPRAAELRLPAPVTSYVGVEGGPAYSPDGSTIAFHWNGSAGEAFDIYVKRIGDESATRLTTDPADDLNPAWSPDGRMLAFLRRQSGYQASVMLMSRDGGLERRLTTISANESTLSWSADGRWIVYSNAYPDYSRRRPVEAGVMAVEVGSGRTIAVTHPGPLTLGDTSPELSPQGRRLAFVRGVSAANGDIHLLDLDENMQPIGQPKRLTFDRANVSSLTWDPNGASLYFVSNRSNQSSASTLWRLSLDEGQSSQPISLGPSRAEGVAVSPIGDEIVFAHRTVSENLWRLELPGEPGGEVRAKRITHSTSGNRQPALSADGRSLAFESRRSGLGEIWMSNADGSNPRQVSFFNGPSAGTPQWSPDGRRLAGDARLDGSGDIFVLDVADGVHRRLTSHHGDDIVPSWSRDGRWVNFASNRTGRYEVWRTPADGGDPIQVTRQGGFHARESVDGAMLFYAKSITETSLWRVPVEGGKEELVLDSLGEWSNFVPVERGLFYFAPPVERRTTLFFYDFATRESRQICTVDAWLNAGVTANRDGTMVIFSQPEPPQSDLMALSLSSATR